MRTINLTSAAAALAVVGLLAGCSGAPTAQQQENGQQQAASGQLVKNQPVPGLAYSQMRQNLIEIETAQAQGIQTTTFIFNRASQDPIQQCPSIGVPIASTASLSNPEQITGGYAGSGTYGVGVVGQMDPNGVYAPSDSLGTYVMCVGPNGAAVPVYAEGEVQTVMGPATWDYGKHQVQLTGAPTFHFTTKQGG